MECDKCNGQGRHPYGFVTVKCKKCEGAGNLDVDAIWRLREEYDEWRNKNQRLEWYVRKGTYTYMGKEKVRKMDKVHLRRLLTGRV